MPSTILQELLATPFRLQTFRKGQKEIIESVVASKDALAVMPTGGGKSLCYQLPALVKEGVVVVICPLISLMEDQTMKLKALGIPAGVMHSGQTLAEKKAVFAEMRTAKQFILYLSPERVQKEGFSNWVKQQKLSLFAIDEAHCVSQWGPDFRSDYYKLSLLRELRPEVPILALTASATPQVLKDIVKQLKLRDPDKHIHGFYRPNLYFQVELCEKESEKLALLKQALRQTPDGRILVYCGTRKQSEAVAVELSGSFGKTGFYHAGMSAEERLEIQKQYEAGEIRILMATNAFGMGIDHADVRLVVHFQMPSNVENYYQEMGRAGRDGKNSTCLLLYSKKDKGLHSFFITQSTADAATIRRRWNALHTIVQFAEGADCRHGGILTYFKDSFRLKACGHCDICDPSSPRRVARIKFAEREWQVPEKSSTLRKSRPHKKSTSVEERPLTKVEELRYEVLREWRKNYAEENDVAAFMVFSNRTLRDLVQKNPGSLAALQKVYGFGDFKVESLGASVLEQLRSCEN